MMLTRALPLTAALLALTACEALQVGPALSDVAPLSTAAAATPPSLPTAGPGTTLVGPAVAGNLFVDICLANLPDFTGTPAALALEPFTQNTGTGTYYHDTLNLSIKLVTENGEPKCSIVFAARAGMTEITFGFGEVVANRAPFSHDVEIDASEPEPGLIYFNAKASAAG
jgi:hypothetical protein